MVIELLTPDELAELFRPPISANRLVALARRGEIPYLVIDGHIRFDVRDVEGWLEHQRSNASVLPRRVTDITLTEEIVMANSLMTRVFIRSAECKHHQKAVPPSIRPQHDLTTGKTEMIDKFHDEIRAFGLEPPNEIEADGKLKLVANGNCVTAYLEAVSPDWRIAISQGAAARSVGWKQKFRIGYKGGSK
jgi:hypothetical protein